MFSLDKSKNDTSVTLDLLRAVAAQMVCVGHAINFAFGPTTSAPSIGVLLFFVLSGFVIAYTLKTKTDASEYSLGRYCVERFCRIYCAYLPAMLLIGGAQVTASAFSVKFGPIDPTDILTFLANLAMLQSYPMDHSFGTFGTAGQMTSIAVEFHIYFFVGALFFLCIGRQKKVAALIAILAATMPLGYFLQSEGRALFLLWLMGFAIYFVVRSIKIDSEFAAIFTVAGAGILYFWKQFANPADVYDIANFPALSISFAALVVVTQCYRAISANALASQMIHIAAGYSLTLFLIHLTLIRIIFAIWPDPLWPEIAAAIVAANLAAYAFSLIGEVHYKRAANYILNAFASLELSPMRQRSKR